MNRYYYTDAYKTEFEASIIERGDGFVVLDGSYFYPTSGGQPHDIGQLNEVMVTDVTVREDDNVLLHWVTAQPEQTQVTGQIDWQRRFDHMQQHTGQHILSQAFIQLCHAPTVGFHLSADTVTIDIDCQDVSAKAQTAVETLANQIIWQNRPIHVRTVSLEEAQTLPIRKIPEVAGETLRLIDIENFDLTACGGTHVLQTGGVGLIKIIKTERHRQKTRVTFACGERALHDYGQKNEILLSLTNHLTTGQDQLYETVQKLQSDLKASQKQSKSYQKQVVVGLAERLSIEQVGETAVIQHIFTNQPLDIVRQVGQQVQRQHPCVVIFGIMAQPTTLLLFSSLKQHDMGAWIKTVLAQFPNGKGGGGRPFAQAQLPQTTESKLKNIIQATLANNLH